MFKKLIFQLKNFKRKIFHFRLQRNVQKISNLVNITEQQAHSLVLLVAKK